MFVFIVTICYLYIIKQTQTTKTFQTMTLFNASASQITEITAIENTDIEFVFNGRLYCLVIDQDEWNALSYSIRNIYGDDFDFFKSCKDVDFAEIVFDLRLYAEDVTESTDKGLAMLRKQARTKLLSWIVSSANKLRSTLKSMSLAMHTAWTKAKILATGFVQFVKVSDVDIEGEIPVQSRRVASLESYGIKGQGNRPSDILRFIDLDKIKQGIHPVSCVISFHVWQVVGWSVKVV